MARQQTDLPTIEFQSASEFETWLAGHYESPDGLWLKIAKKASGITTVTYDEALDIALCYGWIDGQRKAVDEQYFIQRFTPRRPRSKWSKRNREKATALIEAGRMQPPGLREIERAKADGRWEAAYDGPANATVPPD
ncbi:MAG: YdeI/OmpD-associated family protein, partial [Chloroflexota bacterium]